MRTQLNYDNVYIKFNGIRLNLVDYIKYLGMFIDKNLNWNQHVHNLSIQLSRTNGILSRLRYNASLDICLQVYFAIFFSHLTFGCNLWGLTSEENISKIEVLQRKCVRIKTFSPYNSHSSEIFMDMGLLKVRDLIVLSQLC